MASRTRGKKSSAIVPRAVFATVVVAVVPACARNAGQGTAAFVAHDAGPAILAVDAGPADVVRVDAGPSANVRVAIDAGIDVSTGDASGGHDSRAAVADAGPSVDAVIDAGAPVRRHRRETPVSTQPSGIDRFRRYGVARSTFENDPEFPHRRE